MQVLRADGEGGAGLHDDMILVERAIHGGNLALAEGVVERVIDILRGDVESGGGGAIVGEGGFQAVGLLVAAEIDDARQRADFVHYPGDPFIEFIQRVALQGVLIEGTGLAAPDADILCGLG